MYVLDPSLSPNEPVLLADWFKLIGNSKSSKYTFLTSDIYFFNTLPGENVLSGYFYNFGGFGEGNLTLEMGLALNDVAMAVYKKHIVPINNSSTTSDKSKVKILKTVFGNSTTIHKILTENSSGNNGDNPDTTHRSLLTNYPEIITEARTLFQERIMFWMKKTNKLL